jgi:hypothetical protein
MRHTRVLSGILLALVAIAPARAIDLRRARPTPTALAAESPVIVHGTMVGTRSEWNETRDFR